MLRLTQRQINHGVFGLMTGVAVSVFGLLLTMPTASSTSRLAIAAYTLACVVLWVAYWRQWEYARHALVSILTLILATSMAGGGAQQSFSHIIYAIPVLALVLTSPVWVLGSALVLLAAFAYQAGGGPYSSPIDLLVFIVIVGGMVLSRVAVDNAQHLEVAKRESEEARALAERREQELAAQTVELTERNLDQQRLLSLVATLETPAIAVAEGVLLAPIVGTLDSHRADTLTRRLLQAASERRTQKVILDIAGVATVDTQVARSLLDTARALRLLGCQVVMTGISASVAITLTQLDITLAGVSVARSPQDALA
jgi:rsbT co-antagonist protein RsbR